MFLVRIRWIWMPCSSFISSDLAPGESVYMKGPASYNMKSAKMAEKWPRFGGPQPSWELAPAWTKNWVDWLRTSADKRMWSGRRAVVMVRWAVVGCGCSALIRRFSWTGDWGAGHEGYPPPDCSGQGEGQSRLAWSWASRAVAAVPSFQTCFACVQKRNVVYWNPNGRSSDVILIWRLYLPGVEPGTSNA